MKAIKGVLRDPIEHQQAKFGHDLESVERTPVRDWVHNWLSDIVRSNNKTSKTVMITVGIGKTSRLLRLRNDFRLLDESIMSNMAKSYLKSKNRLILLDNEVLLLLL